MNNVVIIMIDAMANVYLKHPITHTSIMPFVDELKARGAYCDDVYAQGPYTEAALTPLYTGRDNLDFGGNFFRGDECKQTLFEYFRENGFDTFNYTQNVIYPPPMSRGLTDERYGLCFYFEAMWDYRLKYYAALPENELTETDYRKMTQIVEDNLRFAEQWLEVIKNREERGAFIDKYCGEYDFEKNLILLRAQTEAFRKDSSAYVRSLLKQGMRHDLFKIESVAMTWQMKNKNDFDDIYRRYIPLFKRIVKRNRRCNKKNNRYSALQLLRDETRRVFLGKGDSVTGYLKKYRYSRKLTRCGGYFRELKSKKDFFKPEPSIAAYFEDFAEFLDRRKNPQKPYLALIHTSSLHTPEVFYSTEKGELSAIDPEMKYAQAYLDAVTDEDRGNLLYALSARYNDYHIRKFMTEMREKGYDKDTVFVVTADHGSSFMYYPLRTCLVNNMHAENYNVPFVAYGKGIKAGRRAGFFTTKDIAASVCVLAGLPVCKHFSGRNICGDEQPPYAISEYLGGGCPDIERNKILFCIRSEKYALVYSVKLKQDFTDGSVDEIYDLRRDPFETHNRPDLKGDAEIKRMLECLRARFEEIKTSYQSTKRF